MTVQPCSLSAEDLIAYSDGYLQGGRRELVEAHLAACPHCQERVAAFGEADRLLREGSPLSDDPEGRAEIRARLGRGDHQWRAIPRSLAAPAFALACLLALVLIAGPVATEAGWPLGRYITFGEIEVKEWLPEEERRPVEHVAPSDPSVLALPFETVEPTTLPFDLALAERSTPDPDRLELLYRNGDDLTILIFQAPARPGMVTIDDAGAGMRETTQVGDTPVMIGLGARPDQVTDLMWERDGVFFTARVLEAPTGAYGGLRTAYGLEVVEAMIAAQDTQG